MVLYFRFDLLFSGVSHGAQWGRPFVVYMCGPFRSGALRILHTKVRHPTRNKYTLRAMGVFAPDPQNYGAKHCLLQSPALCGCAHQQPAQLRTHPRFQCALETLWCLSSHSQNPYIAVTVVYRMIRPRGRSGAGLATGGKACGVF